MSTPFSLLSWIFVLVLWQQLCVISGISLQKTYRSCIVFVGPYVVLVFTLLSLTSVGAIFLTLFLVVQLCTIVFAGSATWYTSRQLSTFMEAAGQGRVSSSLAKINFFLKTMTVLSISMVVFFAIVILFGDQRKSDCSDVVYWAGWEVAAVGGAFALLYTLGTPTSRGTNSSHGDRGKSQSSQRSESRAVNASSSTGIESEMMQLAQNPIHKVK